MNSSVDLLLNDSQTNTLNQIANSILALQQRNGFYLDNTHPLAHIALIHAELSECAEGLRNYVTPADVLVAKDSHLPELPSVGVELADAIMRILAFSALYSIDIGKCLKEKHTYNMNRPYKHNKEI